jgi:hypothetical protein
MESQPSRTPLSQDTSPDIDEAQVQCWREMSVVEKAQLITGLCEAADAFSLAGIRHRYPSASPRECFLRLAILKLGRGLALRVYPEISHLHE